MRTHNIRFCQEIINYLPDTHSCLDLCKCSALSIHSNFVFLYAVIWVPLKLVNDALYLMML